MRKWEEAQKAHEAMEAEAQGAREVAKAQAQRARSAKNALEGAQFAEAKAQEEQQDPVV